MTKVKTTDQTKDETKDKTEDKRQTQIECISTSLYSATTLGGYPPFGGSPAHKNTAT